MFIIKVVSSGETKICLNLFPGTWNRTKVKYHCNRIILYGRVCDLPCDLPSDLPGLLMRSNPLLIFQRSTQHKAGNVIFWIRQSGIFHFTVHTVNARAELFHIFIDMQKLIVKAPFL